MTALSSHLDGQHSSSLGGDLQVDPAPPLSMVTPAQARHRLLAFLVDVHLTSCRGKKEVILMKNVPSPQLLRVLGESEEKKLVAQLR